MTITSKIHHSKQLEVEIFNFDESLVHQNFYQNYPNRILDFTRIGPDIRVLCTFEKFRQFENEYRSFVKPYSSNTLQISFIGSGDFHHVTLAKLRHIKEPFDFLLIDKHPDWARGFPFLHCGTWVSHALEIDNMVNAYHLGSDADLDNIFYYTTPWKHIESKRLTVIPAVKKLKKGRWRKMEIQTLRDFDHPKLNEERIQNLFAKSSEKFSKRPLYISIDKDVLIQEDAFVNWDSGSLILKELETILTFFLNVSKNSIIGVDIVGDWSPTNISGFIRSRISNFSRPEFSFDLSKTNLLNQITNQKIISIFANSQKLI